MLLNGMATHEVPFDHIPRDSANGYGALPAVMEEDEEEDGVYNQEGHLGKRPRMTESSAIFQQ
jgi:hypothetical protein